MECKPGKDDIFLLNREQKKQWPKKYVCTFGPIKNGAFISAKVYYIQAVGFFLALKPEICRARM